MSGRKRARTKAKRESKVGKCCLRAEASMTNTQKKSVCAKAKSFFRIIYYPFGVVVELQYFMCQLVACDSNIKRSKKREVKGKSCSLCCLRPVEYFSACSSSCSSFRQLLNRKYISFFLSLKDLFFLFV